MAGPLDRFFRFTERRTDLATEVRAGLTTFMVMAYIIFVNPIILGYVGVPDLQGKGLPFGATLTVTCLTAGVLSILMGLTSNYRLAHGSARARRAPARNSADDAPRHRVERGLRRLEGLPNAGCRAAPGDARPAPGLLDLRPPRLRLGQAPGRGHRGARDLLDHAE